MPCIVDIQPSSDFCAQSIGIYLVQIGCLFVDIALHTVQSQYDAVMKEYSDLSRLLYISYQLPPLKHEDK